MHACVCYVMCGCSRNVCVCYVMSRRGDCSVHACVCYVMCGCDGNACMCYVMSGCGDCSCMLVCGMLCVGVVGMLVCVML